jgi:hypothetical protein
MVSTLPKASRTTGSIRSSGLFAGSSTRAGEAPVVSRARMWAAEMETLLVERVSATTVVTVDRPDT